MPFLIQVSGSVVAKIGNGGVAGVTVTYTRANRITKQPDNSLTFTFLTDAFGKYVGQIQVTDNSWIYPSEYFIVQPSYMELVNGNNVTHVFAPSSSTILANQLMNAPSIEFKDTTETTIFGLIQFDPTYTNTEICLMRKVPVRLIKGNNQVIDVQSDNNGNFDYAVTPGEIVVLKVPNYKGYSWRSVVMSSNTTIGNTRRKLTDNENVIYCPRTTNIICSGCSRCPYNETCPDCTLTRSLKESTPHSLLLSSTVITQPLIGPIGILFPLYNGFKVQTSLSSAYTFVSINGSFGDMTATGYDKNHQVVNMVMKVSNGCDRGVGILGSSNNNEIDTTHFIQLDFSLINQALYSQISFTIGSTQTGEGFQIYGTNTYGLQGSLTLLYSSSYAINQCPQSYSYAVDRNPKFKYYVVTAVDNSPGHVSSSANILIQSIFLKYGSPTYLPTVRPTFIPTFMPTFKPSVKPTYVPSFKPTFIPTFMPSFKPSVKPTYVPTFVPSVAPTYVPTFVPSVTPTFQPSVVPSYEPSVTPTFKPSYSPSVKPTVKPSSVPTIQPSAPTKAPVPEEVNLYVENGFTENVYTFLFDNFIPTQSSRRRLSESNKTNVDTDATNIHPTSKSAFSLESTNCVLPACKGITLGTFGTPGVLHNKIVIQSMAAIFTYNNGDSIPYIELPNAETLALGIASILTIEIDVTFLDDLNAHPFYLKIGGVSLTFHESDGVLYPSCTGDPHRYHVVYILDSNSKTIAIYINGVPMIPYTESSLDYTSGPVLIGSSGSNTVGMNVQLHQFSIYFGALQQSNIEQNCATYIDSNGAYSVALLTGKTQSAIYVTLYATSRQQYIAGLYGGSSGDSNNKGELKADMFGTETIFQFVPKDSTCLYRPSFNMNQLRNSQYLIAMDYTITLTSTTKKIPYFDPSFCYGTSLNCYCSVSQGPLDFLTNADLLSQDSIVTTVNHLIVFQYYFFYRTSICYQFQSSANFPGLNSYKSYTGTVNNITNIFTESVGGSIVETCYTQDSTLLSQGVPQ